MRLVLVLLRKDFLNFSKDRTAVSLTFLVPIALIWIFGQVFGVTRTDSGPSGIPLAVVREAASPELQPLVDALKREKAFKVVETAPGADGAAVSLTEAAVRQGIRENRYRFALVFPADATAGARFGLRVKFLSNPRNDIETQTVNGLLQKTIFTSVPSLLMQSLRKEAEAAIGGAAAGKFYDEMAGVIGRTFDYDPARVRAAMQRGEILPPATTTAGGAANGADGLLDRLVKIESEQLAGRQVKSPMATRSVGGWAMMFLMFSLSASAASLFEEKKAGLFVRLLATPVRRSHILWSKYAYGILLGLVQLTALFFAGRVLFGIDVLSNFGNLVFACLCAAMACTAFGMLIASVAPSPAAARGLATFLILTMSAVGGAWFPLSFMPEFMQTLGKATLTYWAMEGFTAALWANASFGEMLPICGVLVAMAAAIIAVSLWRFRRSPVFE